jgi:hypothetical protein
MLRAASRGVVRCRDRTGFGSGESRPGRQGNQAERVRIVSMLTLAKIVSP